MVNFFRSLFNCKKKNNHAVHPETNHPNQETDEVIIIKSKLNYNFIIKEIHFNTFQ